MLPCICMKSNPRVYFRPLLIFLHQLGHHLLEASKSLDEGFPVPGNGPEHIVFTSISTAYVS